MNLPRIGILCGGTGSRLGELTRETPKSLISVAGEPFLAHQLRLLRRTGFRDVILLIGHLGEQIRDFAGSGDHFGLNIIYAEDGAVRRGTGGAVRHALPVLGEEFFVLYGDTLPDLDPAAVWTRYRSRPFSALMVVYHNRNEWDRSNVIFDGERVLQHDKELKDTPGLEWIDWGVSVFSADAIREWGEGGPFDLAHLTKELANSGRLGGYEVPHRFYEIGSAEGLREAAAHLASSRVEIGR